MKPAAKRSAKPATIIGSPAFFAWFLLLMLSMLAMQLIAQGRRNPAGNSSQLEHC